MNVHYRFTWLFAAWTLLAVSQGVLFSQDNTAMPPIGRADESPFASDRADTDSDSLGTVRVAGEPVRAWKAPFGDSIRGRLVALSGALVVLSVKDEFVAFPLVGFAQEDREYVRRVLRTRGQGAFFPGVSNPEDEAATLVLSKHRWHEQLEHWRKTIGATQKATRQAVTAWQHLRNIRDPNAMEPLSDLVDRAQDDPICTACVEAIAAIGGREAIRLLVRLATMDRRTQARASALWALCNLKDEDSRAALSEFGHLLRVQRLRAPTLAGLAVSGLLAPLGPYDAPPPIVDTLIDILIVQEPVSVQWYRWAESWGPNGGGGFRYHGHVRTGHTNFRVPVPCEMAHQLLVRQSGRDYGYDRERWRRWYKEQGASAAIHRAPEGDGR